MAPITKDLILEAIATEPLTAGRFIRYHSGLYDECYVCAVGAVLRRVGVDNCDITLTAKVVTEYNYTKHEVAEADNWMSAISIVWETLNYNHPGDIENNRQVLLAWVEDNVPDDYELQIA